MVLISVKTGRGIFFSEISFFLPLFLPFGAETIVKVEYFQSSLGELVKLGSFEIKHNEFGRERETCRNCNIQALRKLDAC